MSEEEMQIRYFTSGPGGPLPFPSSHLDRPIPANNPVTGSPVESAITYRGYLEGIAGFLQGNRGRLTAALHEQGCPACADIRDCDIISEKHGSDYHPARIRIEAGGQRHSFVVNAAFTDRGRNRLADDFSCLRSLSSTLRRRFVPRAYFSGTVPVRLTDGVFQDMDVFLGEWFEGFHEFHPSAIRQGELPSLVLWDLDREFGVLSSAQAEDLYRQASFILTYLYDVENFYEVFPWHHAAGDFVAKVTKEGVDVRLITVRQYAARASFAEPAPENRLNALLLFFAGLTVRMRLDRLDGVGDIAWAGHACVQSTLRGFLEGLREQASEDRCEPELVDLFAKICRAMSPAGWAELFYDVVSAYDRASPDFPVIAENLPEHVFETFRAVGEFPFPALP